MVFPTLFNLSLNFVVRSSWSEPQSALSLVFADYIQLLHLWLQEHNQSDIGIDYLLMSMCRVISWVVGKECLLWPVCSIDKILLDFALLHFVLQGQICLLFQLSLDFLLLQSNLLWWKWQLFFYVSEDSLQKIIVTYSNILAWEIPWIEEMAGYSRRGCKRVGTQFSD